jgi:hypothetical protein
LARCRATPACGDAPSALEGVRMITLFRARSDLLQAVRTDLHRPHPFAAERVGFFLCRAGCLSGDGLVILAAGYHGVEDGDYIDDPRVGAMMGPAAIRKAMQCAYNGGAQDIGLFHVHMHDHRGLPGFSRVDVTESMKFVPDFFNAVPAMPHGAIVLSHDRAVGLCWRKRAEKSVRIDGFASIGAPLRSWKGIT